MVIALPLGTCLCLHCLLLISEFLEGGHLLYSHPHSQSLADLWDITEAIGTQIVGMGECTDVKGST